VNQGLLVLKLKSSLRKFHCRHYDLVNQMTTDIFRLSLLQSRPLLIYKHDTGFVTSIPIPLSLLEQELFTLLDHMRLPRLFVGSHGLIFSLRCSALWTNVLSALMFTASSSVSFSLLRWKTFFFLNLTATFPPGHNGQGR
jgi:hypothetical protein